MPPTELRFTNVVATCNLSTSLFLPYVLQRFPFCEFNRRKFAAMTVRLHSPCSTCLVFGSGRVVCTGASDLLASKLAMLEVLKMCRECGYERAEIRDFSVQNIVASYNYGKPLDLERLFKAYQKEASFQPELFPGLVLRFDNTNVVLLVFESGKLVVTGSKTIQEAQERHQHSIGVLNKVYGPT